jgi:hypothetical protein
LFADSSDAAKLELRLSESRIMPHKLAALARSLELSAIDGHPRTLESLALSSGTSRRTAETAAAVLEDAGFLGLTAGWCRTRVAPPALVEGVARLGAQLGRLRGEDERRVGAIQNYAATPDCKRATIARYFGEQASSRCDRCSSCRSVAIASVHSSTAFGSAPMRRRPAEALTFRMQLDRPRDELSAVPGATSRSAR